MAAFARNVSTLVQALESSDPLARLGDRLRESQRRFECVRAFLPKPLACQLRPGPIDNDGWTLLASNPAVAAKLRQCVPDLQEKLFAERFTELKIRVKVLPT